MNQTYKLYRLGLLLFFLQSLYAWFLWGNIAKLLCMVTCAFLCYNNHKKNRHMYEKNKYAVHVAVLSSLVLMLESVEILTIGRAIFFGFCAYNVMSLKRKFKWNLATFFTRVYGIISLISLIGWLLFLFGIPLPNSDLVDKTFGYHFTNYYIFIYTPQLLYPRFCSIFLEPGQYAMIAVVLLYLNRYNLRNRYVLFIFVSLLFTLSIAGLIIMFLSLILLFFRERKNIVLIALAFSSLYFPYQYFLNLNGGDNVIYYTIFRRLEFEDGEMKGNNRNSADFDAYYQRFIHTPNVIWGDGGDARRKDWDGGNAGYKMYVVTNGIIGTFLTFLAYWIVYRRSKGEKRYRMGLLIIEILLFLQASTPFWFAVFMLFIIASSQLPPKHLYDSYEERIKITPKKENSLLSKNIIE